MRVPSIAVLGGGPGGLFTAWSLQRVLDRPVHLEIYEASARLGGKVRTARLGPRGVPYEAGAAELYDYSELGEDPLRELVAELGLSTRPMEGHAVVVGGRFVANLDDLESALGAEAASALCRFDSRARDGLSPAEFFAADLEGRSTNSAPGERFSALLERVPSRGARRFVETLIHSDLATEPERTSVGYGLQNYVMNDPRYLKLYSIEGGNERLIEALAQRVRAELRLEHEVLRVSRAPSGRLRLAYCSPCGSGEREHDLVVLALPLDALRRVAFEGELLRAAMARHVADYDHPAHYLRLTLLFERPFWRARLQDSYAMLEAFGGACLYDESSRTPEAGYGLLGWLLGGAAALEHAKLDDATLLSRALEELPFDGALVRELFVAGAVHRWNDAVNAMPGGLSPRSHARRHQPEPEGHPELFVVGDYLFDSTLNGVLDSADHVAMAIAARLAASSEEAA
ncbi:MAG: FAD-dependent oxidoreductase [Planctomycetes bacterium]|nr:FAD-dependent oxidoreductase [Planctomycetota bacterium]